MDEKGEAMSDLISRQDVIGVINNAEQIYINNLPTMIYKHSLEQAIMTIPAQPEPQSRMVFGYPLEYLVAFAEACRRANVDESDLKTFANNCTFAYATMADEYRQQINHVIDAFMGNAGGTNDND